MDVTRDPTSIFAPPITRDNQEHAVVAEFAQLSVDELAQLGQRVVNELARRVALAQYGTALAVTGAGDVARARAAQQAGAGTRTRVPAEVDGAPAGAEALGALANDGARLSNRDALILASGSYAVELVQGAVRMADQLRAVAGLAAARVDAMEMWAADGSRSVTAWLSRTLGVAWRTAGALVRTGRLLRDHGPALGRAVLSGGATWDHAASMRFAASSAKRREALAQVSYAPHIGYLVTGDEQLT